MIRIVIVDDHVLMRDLLAHDLNREEGIEVIATFGTGEEALVHNARLQPDLLILDVSLPGKSGLAVLSELRALGHQTPILMLSMHMNAAVMQRAMRSGANGYVVKQDSFGQLLEAVRSVAKGATSVSSYLKGAPTAVDGHDQDGEILARLTDREQQVLALIANGFSSTEIAEKLRLSARTVDFHRRNIITKTGLSKTAQLTKFAIRVGLPVDM